MNPRPHRRAFVKAVLAACAGAACPVRAAQDAGPRRIFARFVGDAYERGHHWLLSDAAHMHVSRRERARVVVVGAGIAGVVAAWRVIEGGVDACLLLDLEDVAGGHVRRGRIESAVVPFGGMTLAQPDAATSEAVRRVIGASGVPLGDTMPASPFEPGGAFEDAAPAATDDLAVADWLRAARAPAETARFAEHWCLARFGARASCVSAAALVADVARRYGRAQGRAVPLRGGAGALLAPLLERIGERFQSGRMALRVTADSSTATVRFVNAHDATVTDCVADALVLAVPPFIAARITPALQSRAHGLAMPSHAPWLVAAVQVSDWPGGLDPATPPRVGVDERATLMACVEAPDARVVIVHRPFPARDVVPARMILRDWDPPAARDWILREVAPVLPDLAAKAVRIEILRVAHGPARPGPGYLTAVAPALRTPMPPIHPCGADCAGIPCIESAIEDGVRAAENVLRALGMRDASWL